MMAILLFHAENYYAGSEIIPYALYVDNALLTFFFISGYLFVHPGKPFSLRLKLMGIVRGMALPYFLFTTAIAFPKAFVHADTSLSDALALVLTGHASWFIAALMVAEGLFGGLLWLTRGRLLPLGGSCALAFAVVALLCRHLGEPWAACNLWCWQNACICLPLLFFGHACRRSGRWFCRFHRPRFLLLLAVLMAGFKWLIHATGLLLTLEPIHVSSFAVLLADGVLGALLLTGIARHLPALPPVQFTGRHSLYYYFICGGVPLLASRAFAWAGLPYSGHYLPVVPLFLVVWAAATAIVAGIVRAEQALRHKR